MKISGKPRVLLINIVLFVLLFGLVSLNKGFLRPAYSHIPLVRVLTGCFPNFIAAFIVSLACVNGVLIREPRQARLIIYLSSLLVFATLTIEELKPMWGASTHYDSLDIIASGLGSLLAVVTYELIAIKRTKES